MMRPEFNYIPCTCLVRASDGSVLCTDVSYHVFGTISAYLLLIFKRSTVGPLIVPERKYCGDQSFLLRWYESSSTGLVKLLKGIKKKKKSKKEWQWEINGVVTVQSWQCRLWQPSCCLLEGQAFGRGLAASRWALPTQGWPHIVLQIP